MNTSVHGTSRSRRKGPLLAAACSSDKTATPSTTGATASTASTASTEPVVNTANTSSTTAPAPTTEVAGGTSTPSSAAAGTSAPTSPSADPSAAFPNLAPPTGSQMVIGLVNTEGTPGLDFPEIRVDVQASVDYLNKHGGMGGRTIKLETCTAKGSPETSQACAQELAGKKVEMVLLGLDLFPDYATYTAAGIPVVGVLPILPGDYTAKALFLTGGNATTTGAMAAVAKNHFKATTVGIVSSDNPGANGTEASLTAALDLAGIAHFTVKGGDNETDAGYQGLMREAAKKNPDLLVSLYSDAGCIGTIRGRAALGITIPVITTAVCSSKNVLSQVGDDAVGWSFVGVATQKNTPELAILQEILAPSLGVAPSEVDSTALGLGGLGVIGMMSLAQYADMMNAHGDAVTGASLYAYLGSATGLKQWPGGADIACGSAAKYPSICAFTFPVSEYVAGGSVVTIQGLEAVSARDYLP
jgi:ABC-type branched-subunit amino acid transport system substrate-binding protein